MKQKKQTKKESFLEVFNLQVCNVSDTCKATGISRSTYYRWIKEEQFKEGIDSAIEGMIDMVEGQLLKNINRGNVTAQIFFLKTRGRHRGYDEKQVIEHRDINRKEFRLLYIPSVDGEMPDQSRVEGTLDLKDDMVQVLSVN